MSNVYATEPATSARVIVETTHGPLDIKLWCRECPATTRLFLQLCLDGFYDGMLFHRIVPSLLIQTGALRSGAKNAVDMTQYRQEISAEEALERRQYELNPRIRFNHRGQVAMALEVDSTTDAKDMQPQFFITTEAAPYLDRKHVVFGTLGAGSPTVFNAIRICGVAVNEATNQPVELEHAPRIVSTKIMDNEIHTDLLPRPSVPWRPTTAAETKAKKKKKRKGKFDTNVLSFGDEVEDFVPIVKRTKAAKKDDEPSKVYDGDQQQHRAPSLVERERAYEDEPLGKQVAEMPGEPRQVHMEHVYQQPSTHPKRIEDESGVEPQISAIELRRARFANRKKTKEEREEETLQKLMKFRGKLKENVLESTADQTDSHGVDNSLAARMARRAENERMVSIPKSEHIETYRGQILHSSDNEEEGSNDWLKTRFQCRRHMDHTAGQNDNDDYEVVDERKHETLRRKERKERDHRREN